MEPRYLPLAAAWVLRTKRDENQSYGANGYCRGNACDYEGSKSEP